MAYIEEYPNGCREFYTFKDKHFMQHWAIGENNIGMEINLKTKGAIVCNENEVSVIDEKYGLYDIVGEYTVELNGKKYDTVRLFFIGAENQVSDFFIAKDGKEIMHRFFIPDEGYNGDMKENPYSTQFPNAYTITINNTRKCTCVKYVLPEYVF